MALGQEMAVDAAVFQGLCDFGQHAVRVAQALLADGGTDAADRVFEGRRRRITRREGGNFPGFVSRQVDDIRRFIGIEADFGAFYRREQP